MESPRDIKLTSSCLFRGSEYIVTMEVKDGEELLIEVEDRITADQWKGTFDATYIQDLTHKTGNFKQFHIFTSMMESALNKNSDTVSLDLLTFSDLESLRARKTGATTQSTLPGSRNSSLNSKRYFILTYTVEFDRIHYPLPLPYVGKPDPRSLQDSIRQLQTENKRLKESKRPDYRSTSRDYDRLQSDYKKVLKEKEDLEDEIYEVKREIKSTSNNIGSVKEIKMLKGIVRNLEEELMKEKNKYQRATSKRGQEYRELLAEVEELRASERTLRIRVKSLTNELASYKRDKVKSSQRMMRPLSRERSGDRYTSIISNRERPPSRGRSNSRDRPSSAPNRSRVSDRSPINSFTSNRSRLSDKSPRNYRSRTPSPAGSRNGRFDPSAYVKEKERLMKEANSKRARQNRANTSGGSSRSKPLPNRNNNNGRISVLSRNRSRNSSLGSQGEFSDTGATSDSSVHRYSDFGSSSRTAKKLLSSPHTRSRSKERKPPPKNPRILASTPESDYGRSRSVRSKKTTPDIKYSSRSTRRRDHSTDSTSDKEDDGDYLNCSDEISEIDDRLNRLQQLMKTSLS